MDSKMLVSWKMKVEELLKAGRKKFGGKRLENMLGHRSSGVLLYNKVTIVDNALLIFEARRKDFGCFTIGKRYILEEINRFAIF